MKYLVAPALVVLGLLVPVAQAADTTKAAPAAKPAVAPVKPTTGPVKPAATTVAKPVEPKKVTLAEPVTGLLLARKNGGFLNLRVENNNWVLTFWTSAKEEMKPDVSRAIVRFRRNSHDNRFNLTPSADGKALTSTFFVERPYRFTVTVVLTKDGVEEAVDTMTQLFNQPMPGDGESVSGDALTPEQAKKVKN